MAKRSMNKPSPPSKRKARSSRNIKRHQPGVPNAVDIHVGSRVRQFRTRLGLSQEKLGDAVGLTFQQIQKYERGANRVGASRLFQFSRILGVPVSYFFDQLPSVWQPTEKRTAALVRGRDQTVLEADPMSRRETLDLVRAYYQISDPKVRKRLYDFTKALASTSRDN